MKKVFFLSKRGIKTINKKPPMIILNSSPVRPEIALEGKKTASYIVYMLIR